MLGLWPRRDDGQHTQTSTTRCRCRLGHHECRRGPARRLVWLRAARDRRGAVLGWQLQRRAWRGRRRDHRLTPVAVVGITDATALAVGTGSAFGCARRANGRWACWGAGDYGVLANGDVAEQRSPVDTPITDDELALGGISGCARKANVVRCWGWNGYGQHGDGRAIYYTQPIAIPALPAAGDYGAGDGHLCTVGGGVAHCSGYNTTHQLGDGTQLPRMTPVAVTGVTTADSVSSSLTHSCATLTDMTAMCWGDNFEGQLGTDATGPPSDAVAVTGLAGLANIGTGNGFTCTQDTTNRVVCWGQNDFGQLGDGMMTSRPAKQPVMGITDAISLGVGDKTVCVSRVDGSVACWGKGTAGQLGNGTMANTTCRCLLARSPTRTSRSSRPITRVRFTRQVRCRAGAATITASSVTARGSTRRCRSRSAA